MPFVSPVLTASIKLTAASLAALLSCDEQPVRKDIDNIKAMPSMAGFFSLNIILLVIAQNVTFNVINTGVSIPHKTQITKDYRNCNKRVIKYSICQLYLQGGL